MTEIAQSWEGLIVTHTVNWYGSDFLAYMQVNNNFVLEVIKWYGSFCILIFQRFCSILEMHGKTWKREELIFMMKNKSNSYEKMAWCGDFLTCCNSIAGIIIEAFIMKINSCIVALRTNIKLWVYFLWQAWKLTSLWAGNCLAQRMMMMVNYWLIYLSICFFIFKLSL